VSYTLFLACFDLISFVSTTPLYHGGLADLVRSLNSEAMLYLFPPDVPITKYNILKSLDACSRYGSEVSDDLKYHCQIKYFSCVPHILKMLVEGEEAGGSTMKILKGLDMLGTGGAPLPKELGDRMVEEGVHLISRYGSAECGFLMSSARDFKDDREWQYLRSDGSGGALVFEQQEEEDGEEIAELVIQPSWPCIVGNMLPSFLDLDSCDVPRLRQTDPTAPLPLATCTRSTRPYLRLGSILVVKMIWYESIISHSRLNSYHHIACAR
jgi:acyl-CoA synthetase (AMP-forming)/AMP-acid ligase II